MAKKTGVQGSYGFKMPHLSSALQKVINNLPLEPRQVLKDSGQRNKGQGKKLVPDEIILEMRRLREFEGKKPREIAKLYPHLPITYIYQVLSYQTRGNIYPKKETK